MPAGARRPPASAARLVLTALCPPFIQSHPNSPPPPPSSSSPFSQDFFDQSMDEIKLLQLLNQADPEERYPVLRLFDYFYHREHLFIVCELLRDNLYEVRHQPCATRHQPCAPPCVPCPARSRARHEATRPLHRRGALAASAGELQTRAASEGGQASRSG